MKLLVVDAQQGLMTQALYQYEILKAGIAALIAAARENGVEVLFVRHDDGPGQALTPGAPGYDIDPAFAPRPNERIFDKTVNSAFRAAGLRQALPKGETLMVVGLQTEYCIDATVKAGFEHGFSMVVPEGCHSTFDNEHLTAQATYHYYNDFIWKNRYARCISLPEALALLSSGPQ